MGEQKRKLARHASNEENSGKVEGLKTKIGLAMPQLMELLQGLLPGCGITLFVTEPERFNYVSNQEREDMVSMLAAFLTKNKDLIDKQKLDEALAAIKPEGGPQ